MKYVLLLAIASACTSTTKVDTTVDTTQPCIVQPDCCSPASCIRSPESYSCDTDCDRSQLSCEEEEDGSCTLVGEP